MLWCNSNIRVIRNLSQVAKGKMVSLVHLQSILALQNYYWQ